MNFNITRTTAADEMGGIRAYLAEPSGNGQPVLATLIVPGFTSNKVLLDQIRAGGMLELIIGKANGGIVTPPGPKPDPVPEPRA